jgi:multidrug efflux pump subunit AcrB
MTLLVFIATVTITGLLFVAIPKGFFPTQDVGLIIGISEGAQDSSFARMAALQEKLNDIVGRDPAVASYASQVGAGTAGQQGNDGRMFINLKPWTSVPATM